MARFFQQICIKEALEIIKVGIKIFYIRDLICDVINYCV